MACVSVRQVLRNLTTGRDNRVIALHPVVNLNKEVELIVWLIDTRAKQALPFPIPESKLSQELRTGNFAINEIDASARPAIVRDELVHPRALKVREQAWAAISGIIDNPKLLDESQRLALVLSAAKASKLTRQSIYKYIRRYWQRGMTKNALIADYQKCGKPKKGLPDDEATDASPAKKRGPPGKHGTQSLVAAGDALVARFTPYWNRYKKDEFYSHKAAYDEMVRDAFTVQDDEGKLVAFPLDQIPTLYQFTYHFHKHNQDYKGIQAGRKGQGHVDRNLRELMKTVMQDVYGPGHRFQIDPTIGDIYLVSMLDRNRIVGRPVIYFVVDTFSRMICGLWVGFEGPSWVTAMMALVNVAEDKVSFCKEYGIEISEAEWPCKGLPAIILGDKGEMESHMPERLINLLLVDVENTPSYRADLKPIVEPRFRLIPKEYKRFTPGYIRPDYQERGGKDYRLDATLNIREFTKLLILAVLKYNKTIIGSFPLLPDMIGDKIPARPINLWNWGIEKRSGKLRQFPAELVKFALMPADTARVMMHGIKFKGLHYTCAEALEGQWFSQARGGDTWEVAISYDPRDIDRIYLHDDNDAHKYIVCTLTDAHTDVRGKGCSFADYQALSDDAADINADGRHEDLQASVDFLEAADDVIEKAKAEAAATKDRTLPKSQRTKDIRGNRKAEAKEIRREEAFNLLNAGAGSGSAKVINLPGNPPSDNTSERLKARNQQREAMLNGKPF